MTVRDWSTFRVGLTGGIASGKTTVAQLFAARGVPVIDTDELAREVVAPGTPGLAAVVAAFGPEIRAADGSLDRQRLRRLVFADDGQRRVLERILHPRIRAELEARSRTAGGPYQLLVIPLLAESALAHRVDRVLVVDCSEEVQRQRLMVRDGESAASATRILGTQASRASRLALADDVIENTGTGVALVARVEVLDHHYRQLAARENGQTGGMKGPGPEE